MYAARPAQPDRITSLHNPRIKDVLRLQDKAAERRRQGLTLVEGYRELANARQAGWQVATLFVCEELAGDEITQQLAEPARLVPRPYEYLPVSAAVFAKLAVREVLMAEATGGANVRYIGSPEVTKTVSGGGTVSSGK